jgi:UDPglucose 6-dehydrogenase
MLASVAADKQDYLGVLNQFKPVQADTDDMREAPSTPLVIGLTDMGAIVRAYDPVGMPQAKHELSDITYCNNSYECAIGADALVIISEWVQFQALDFERLKRETRTPLIVDLRVKGCTDVATA